MIPPFLAHVLSAISHPPHPYHGHGLRGPSLAPSRPLPCSHAALTPSLCCSNLTRSPHGFTLQALCPLRVLHTSPHLITLPSPLRNPHFLCVKLPFDVSGPLRILCLLHCLSPWSLLLTHLLLEAVSLSLLSALCIVLLAASFEAFGHHLAPCLLPAPLHPPQCALLLDLDGVCQSQAPRAPRWTLTEHLAHHGGSVCSKEG